MHTYYNTFSLTQQKPLPPFHDRQLRGADPSVVIRPETTDRTPQTVSGVPLEGGQAHRGHDQIRTIFVLTTLTQEGIIHPRVIKEPPYFTYILAYPAFKRCSARVLG